MKNLNKQLPWLILLALGVGGGILWWQLKAKSKKELPPEVVAAKRGDLSITVSATGTVEPEYTVEIKSRASGEVEKVTKEEGAQVKKDELLVVIDPIVEQRRVNQAKASLSMSKAKSASAWYKYRFIQTQLKRDSKLLKKGLVSREAVDTLTKEAAVLAGEGQVSEAQIKKDKEALKEANDRLSETKIKSPINGTVLERLVQPGQIVASGTNSVSGGTTLLRLADLSKLFVRVKIDETDVAVLKPGMPVEITADALPNRVFSGKLLRISPQGTVESNVTVFQVIVAVGEKGSKSLKPMMSANIEILVASSKGVILLPQKAVRSSKKKKGGKFVILEDGTFRRVKVGKTFEGQAEIAEGLKEGEKVRLPGKGPSKRGKKPGAKRGGMRGMRRMMGR